MSEHKNTDFESMEIKPWLEKYTKRKLKRDISEIETLEFHNCNLKVIPDSIADLINLKILDLSFCNLKSVPESFADLFNLKVLNIRWCDLKKFPESIANLKNLEILDLTDNNLSILPEAISKLNYLTDLDFSYNNLTILPEEIGGLSNLERLNLDYNNFTIIPKAIFNLKKLKNLSIGYNELHSLPDDLGASNIHSLNLTGNTFRQPSPTISNLTNLRILDIAYNRFSSFPDLIFMLPRIESLYLSDSEKDLLSNEQRNLIQSKNISITIKKHLPRTVAHNPFYIPPKWTIIYRGYFDNGMKYNRDLISSWVFENVDIFHKVVRTIVKETNGRYLFNGHMDFSSSNSSIKIDFPLGIFDESETPEKAALRIVKEKTGFNGSVKHAKMQNLINEFTEDSYIAEMTVEARKKYTQPIEESEESQYFWMKPLEFVRFYEKFRKIQNFKKFSYIDILFSEVSPLIYDINLSEMSYDDLQTYYQFLSSQSWYYHKKMLEQIDVLLESLEK